MDRGAKRCMAVPFFRRGRAGKSGIPPLFFLCAQIQTVPTDEYEKRIDCKGVYQDFYG